MCIDKYFTVVNDLVIEITESMYMADALLVTSHYREFDDDSPQLLYIYKKDFKSYSWVFNYEIYNPTDIRSSYGHFNDRKRDEREANRIMTLILEHINR